MDIYAYQRLVGKIEDNPNLRQDFIALYDTKSHTQIVKFCMALAEHLSSVTHLSLEGEIQTGLIAMQEWLDGEVNYHKARNISLEVSRIAKTKNDIVEVRYLRTIAQILASPHVKYHGLWATDFAVTLINRMKPGDLDAVSQERMRHIEILQDIT